MDWLRNLVLGKFLKPVWEWFDGKKTVAGAVITALAAVNIGVHGSTSIEAALDLLKANTGADLYLTTGELTLLIGLVHKLWKKIVRK